MLSRTEHDLLILLAEDVNPFLAGEAVGLKTEKSLHAKIYRLAAELEVPRTGDYGQLIQDVVTEAKLRNYQNQVYCFMLEPGEEGYPPPKRLPVITREEGAQQKARSEAYKKGE